MVSADLWIRQALYFGAHSLIGNRLGQRYREVASYDRTGNAQDITNRLLLRQLLHCRDAVPYYGRLIQEAGANFNDDPVAFLQQLPILTKDIIRREFEQLKSSDLGRRSWYYNTSGGSTGEPVRFIQDRDYSARLVATQLLMANWAGKQLGEPEVLVWGSLRDVLQGSAGWKMSLLNALTNTTWLNAHQMSIEAMRTFLDTLNRRPPKLITAYPHAIYELAHFAERERLPVSRQAAIITSSGMLHPWMRQKIEQVFQCRVFNRYGSREVGDIACECKAHAGLHVFPWNNYVEIVDEQGARVPNGTEGNIVVTCLTNFAMPLLRYAIGDRGVLSKADRCSCGRAGQILERVVGRSIDMFSTKGGTLLSGGVFTQLLYFRDWVGTFQVIQKDYAWIVFRIVRSTPDCPTSELEEIKAATRKVMGTDCEVTFEFVEHIAPGSNGKYRYVISELDTVPEEAVVQ